MSQSLQGVMEAALYASDLDAAEHFYETVLGLEKVARQGNRRIFFRCGQTIVLIFNPTETLQSPPAGALPVPSHGATGAGHLCFRVPGEEIAGVLARLQQADVKIESDFHWPSGARSIYFRDPAGNSLECAEPKLWNLD